jgi:CRISPR-associated protein Csm1
MDERSALYFGALLHDVGKVVYRGTSEAGTHSKLGANFLLNDVQPQNHSFDSAEGKAVIEQVRYHHARELNSADLPSDSLAYITYFADNISAGMDRKNEGEEDAPMAFNKAANMHKIFNILKGHNDKNTINHDDYNAIRQRLCNQLRSLEIASVNVNSLINLLEATVDKVPSSTDVNQLIDVSLFDHLKTTAGIAACMYDYLKEQGITDFKQALFDSKTSVQYYDAPMFLMLACDISGIQSFIYDISGSGALKQLRARSLYLELLMEHVVDTLLERLDLSRANLMYTGGGHAYLLLPNTQHSREIISLHTQELNEWFLANYGIGLYMASAFVECSANDLMNKGEDKSRYSSIFRNLSQLLSDSKSSRYNAEQLIYLNYDDDDAFDGSRECSECHRSDNTVDSQGRCELCSSLGRISSSLVSKNVFAVQNSKVISDSSIALKLPFDSCLVLYDLNQYIAESPNVIRVYTKNDWHTGLKLSTHLWMGNYTADTNFEGVSYYASHGVTLEPGSGVKRLGVLRADVDNLGEVFTSGIPEEKISISRTATLSRALSYFFKFSINEILKSKNYQVQIIYSGGDDLFLVGNWSDVVYAAIDIRKAFAEFVGNESITLSAGIGTFPEKYPIARMAHETGDLEDAAKMHVWQNGEKDSIALWSTQNVFTWNEFDLEVLPLANKMTQVFLDNDKGKAFIYKVIALLRNFDDVISAPRLAYLLTRSFEKNRGGQGQTITKELFEMANNSNKRRYLIAALEWYVYSIRER